MSHYKISMRKKKVEQFASTSGATYTFKLTKHTVQSRQRLSRLNDPPVRDNRSVHAVVGIRRMANASYAAVSIRRVVCTRVAYGHRCDDGVSLLLKKKKTCR